MYFAGQARTVDGANQDSSVTCLQRSLGFRNVYLPREGVAAACPANRDSKLYEHRNW